MITLKDIYEIDNANDELIAFKALYDLLAERQPDENISHAQMPSWQEHLNFVVDRPYLEWYIITLNDQIVGSIYITERNEIGVSIFSYFRRMGYGTAAIRELIKLHPNKSLLANISPKNNKSISLFENLGFKHIQNTYKFTS